MANGANRRFMANPKDFIRNHIIDVQVSPARLTDIAKHHQDAQRAVRAKRGRLAPIGEALTDGRKAGIFDFDLSKTKDFKASRETRTLGIRGTKNVTVYQLKEWGIKERDQEIVKNDDDNSFTVQYKVPAKARPIRAYWVPWNSNAAWSVRLGNEADYFFTPTMDGCTLAIGTGANPVITHGNYKQANDQTRVSQQRTENEIERQHALQNSGIGRWLRKDAYAASHEEKLEGINNVVTVIGIRKHGAWRFYYQRRQINAERPDADILLTDRLVEI